VWRFVVHARQLPRALELVQRAKNESWQMGQGAMGGGAGLVVARRARMHMRWERLTQLESGAATVGTRVAEGGG
jgi:hypothetical protein